ncbi:MAG: hypothetical protein K8W52_11175 [Deltaproteobacteria bacterium]|nr:hypothetical protein [Deltaproteobacteria bacterium]
MTMHGGTSARYYRCQANRSKGAGVCANWTSVREDIVRRKVLAAITERLTSAEGLAYIRTRIAAELGAVEQSMATELAERRARLGRAEDKMRGLVEFIASGDRTEYVVTTLRDLDAYAKDERAQIAALEAAAGEPLRLPSIDDVLAQVIDLDARLAHDPEAGRARLGRWLKDSAIRVGPSTTGEVVAEGDLLPLVVIDESGSRKRHYAESRTGNPRRYTVVAGAGFEPATFGL